MAAIGRILQRARFVIIRSNFHEGIKSSSAWSLLLKPESGWQACGFGTSNQSIPKVRARTPYILFVTEKMGDLRTANPGVRIPDLGRMLGQMWRVLPEDEKEVYRARYREEKVSFDEKKKIQLEKLTKEEKDEMKKEARDRRKRKTIRRRRKLLKDLDKPKPADVNPYILFVKSKMLERGDAPFQQYVKGMAEYWKKMPEEDKQPYLKAAKENSTRYRIQLAEWERRMIAEGHENLVRRSALKRPTRSRKIKRRKKTASKKKGAESTGKKTKSVGTQTEDAVTTAASSQKAEAGNKSKAKRSEE